MLARYPEYSDLPSTILQDKDFVAAPLAEKYQYLAHVDPDFAAASPEDKQGYMQHLLGGPAPTPAPASQQDPGFWSHAIGSAKNVLRGLPWMAAGDPTKVAAQAIQAGGSMAVDDLVRQGEGRSGAYRIAAPAAQMLVPGLNPAAMEEAANQGDWRGVLGEATTPAALAASPLAAEGAGRGANYLREGLQDVAYREYPQPGMSPKPQLTATASRASRAAATAAGAGIGHAMGIPGAGYAGGVAGFELGPTLLERILGKPELGDVRNPGPFSRISDRAKAQVPPEQVPFADSPTTSPADVAQLPWTRYATRQAQSASPTTSTGRSVQMEIPGTPKPKSMIVDPNSPAPNVRVTYQSVPQPDLYRMVRSGDMDAIREWQRRGLDLPENVGFMTESNAGTLPWRRLRR